MSVDPTDQAIRLTWSGREYPVATLANCTLITRRCGRFGVNLALTVSGLGGGSLVMGWRAW
jgi:hypothetical protein